MVGESNQNVLLIQIDASNFAEFEISEFEIARVDCNTLNFEIAGKCISKFHVFQLLLYDVTGDSKYSRDVTSFLQQWRPQGSVPYTNGGLAWRGEWGTLRYTGTLE